jgi:2-haloacid dehalogenase
MTFDFDRFEALTFDCYGTLIDWEAGIVAAFSVLLGAHGVQLSAEEILRSHARHEARIEEGPFRIYRDVLVEVGRAVCLDHDVDATDEELADFGGSVADWPEFDDSADALAALATRFRLGVITNCDDDLFAASNRKLGVVFDAIVTAQQVQSYKPSRRNFEAMFERIKLSPDRILHVAQSLYHDHVPAKELGLTTVWVDRRHGRQGSGATPEAAASPDLTVPDMASLAAMALEGDTAR